MSRLRWETAAGLSVVALLTALCLAPAAWAGPRVTLTSPHAFQVFQRDSHDRASILVSGRGAGFAGPVQVRWGGGAWLTVPRGADGSFSVVLAHRKAGQKTLIARAAHLPWCTARARYVGVGDIYVIAGQSNAVGRSDTLFQYWSPTLHATLFGNDDRWGELRDPVDSPFKQVDRVSLDPKAGGSVWPGVATGLMAAEHVPVAFVPCARGGTTIAEWQRAAATPQSAGTLYGSMVRRIAAVGGRVRAVLFWQGEADARVGMPGADYEAALQRFAADVHRDCRCRVVVAQMGDYCAERWAAASVVAIRAAQQELWGQGAIVAGPVLYDIDLADKVHFTAPDAVETAARRWTAAILSGVLRRDVGGPSRLTGASYDGDRIITLTFDTGPTPLRPGLAGGIVVGSPSGPVTPESAIVVPPDDVQVTLTAPLEGPLTVSLGAGRTAAGAAVPVEDSSWLLPPMMFVSQPATRVSP